jgi:replicative DNA helicase
VSANLAEFNFVEAGVNLPDNLFRRNIIIPINKVDDFRKRYNNTGVYITAYRYDSEKIRDSKAYSDLYFDFDKENDFEAVRKDALTALSYIKTVFGIDYNIPNIYFSGHKGVHITVPAECLGAEPSENLNEIYKLIATDVNAALANNTLDTVIYDKVRLFRLVNSVHQKTGLYKIPLTYEELKNLEYEAILDLATSHRKLTTKESPIRIEQAASIFRNYTTKYESSKNRIRERSGKIIRLESTPPCIEWILYYGAGKGKRNDTAIVLASHYRQKGFSYEEVLDSILNWNAQVLENPLPENEIERTVKQVFDNKYIYGCQTIKDLATCEPTKCELARREQMQSATPCLKLVTPENIEQIQRASKLLLGRECYDYEQEMMAIIDKVEEYNWSRGALGGLSFGDKEFDEAFNGLQPALYVLAGQPNIGKSMLALQLAWNVIQNNENAYVIYFAIDDPDVTILPRLMAIDQRIPINVAKIPAKYADNPILMEKRDKGLTALRRTVNRFKLLDKKFGYSAEYMIQVARAHKAKFEAISQETGEPPKQLAIFIDNLYDVRTEEKAKDPQLNLQIVSEKLDEFCETDLVPIFCTGELKKLNGVRRPILDDLKDTIELQYDASAVMLCYNEVQVKGERADVYHQILGKDGKQPVLEVHVAKNKLGEHHGRMFYHMYPGYSYIDPVGTEGAKFYNGKMQN